MIENKKKQIIKRYKTLVNNAEIIINKIKGGSYQKDSDYQQTMQNAWQIHALDSLWDQANILELEEIEKITATDQEVFSDHSQSQQMVYAESYFTLANYLLCNPKNSTVVILISYVTNLKQLSANWQNLIKTYQDKIVTIQLLKPKTFFEYKIWLRQVALNKNIKLSSNTLSELILNYNYDQQLIVAELDKISLLNQYNQSEQIISSLIKSRNISVFKVIEHLVKGDLNKSLVELQNIFNKGTEQPVIIFQLLGLMLRQIMTIKLAQDMSLTESVLTKKLKQPAWMVKKNWQIASNLDGCNFIEVFAALANADLKIKILGDISQPLLINFCSKIKYLLHKN